MNVRELDKRVIAFATREVWKKKLVQAKRIRCQKCVQIVKLWLKTYGYGPKKVRPAGRRIPVWQGKKNDIPDRGRNILGLSHWEQGVASLPASSPNVAKY